MGCTQSKQTLHPIPPPKGPPIDPLHGDCDPVQAITNDPHIHFFKNKLQQVILPARKKSQTLNKNNQKLTIQKFATADQQEHKKYVQTINKAVQGNAASVTNIMGLMMQQMSDARQGGKAQKKFGNDNYAALKCFVYLYTGHYAYKNINSQLRRNQYDKISSIISVVQKQLEEYNKEKFSRKLKANIKYGQFLNLYRGIPKPDKTLMKGKKLYWKGFTSTSLESSVAARFGRYTFVITLEKNNPHPYMIVPQELSQFKEEEIILFPYFFFQCMGVENFTSGARYECKQILANEE